jgi:hypothetical protein
MVRVADDPAWGNACLIARGWGRRRGVTTKLGGMWFILDNTKIVYMYNHLIFLLFLQGIEIKSVFVSYWHHMSCSEKKLSKYLTQIFIAYCNVMICQQARCRVRLSGRKWPTP